MTIVGALPFTLQNGTTADATQVMADFNSIKTDVNSHAAANGANNDITSLAGLTTPLSVAQGGTGSILGPGTKLLVASTVSSQATLSLVLTAYTSYRAIQFMLNNWLPVTDNVALTMQFSTNGGSSYIASGYFGALGSMLSGSGSGPFGNYISLTGGVGNGSTRGLNGLVTLQAQTGTTLLSRARGEFEVIDAGGAYDIYIGGGQNAAMDVDAVRFAFVSGNIASGSYAVYGYL
jgi:hypothetical protein